MSSQTVLAQKKRRGPKPTGKGTQVVVRLQPDLLSDIDALRQSRDPVPSRPDVIREALHTVKQMGGFDITNHRDDLEGDG